MGMKSDMVPPGGVDMKRIILIAVCLLGIAGPVSAYQSVSQLSGIRAGWSSVKLFG